MSQPMEDAAVAEKAKRVAILALILFAIPILGWLTSLYVESSLDDQCRKAMVDGGVISAATYDANNLGYMKACGPNGLLAETKDATKLCSYAAEVTDSRRASLITAGIGVGLLLLIFIGKGVAGTHANPAYTKHSCIHAGLISFLMGISIQDRFGRRSGNPRLESLAPLLAWNCKCYAKAPITVAELTKNLAAPREGLRNSHR